MNLSSKKLLFRLLNTTLLLFVLIFVGRALLRNLLALRDQPLSLNWGWLGLSMLAYAGMLALNSQIWRFVMGQLGDRSSAGFFLRHYIRSLFGRYVPGKAWLLLLRLQSMEKAGLSRRNCVVSSVYETAIMTLTGLLVAAMGLGFHLGGVVDSWVYVVGPLVAGVALMHPRVFYPLFNFALKKTGKDPLPREVWLQKRSLFAVALMFAGTWTLGGLSLWMQARATGPVGMENFPECVYIFAAAITFGIVAIFAPVGVGVREGIYMALLSRFMPVGQAALVAVIARALTILTEVAVYGVAWWGPWRERVIDVNKEAD